MRCDAIAAKATQRHRTAEHSNGKALRSAAWPRDAQAMALLGVAMLGKGKARRCTAMAKAKTSSPVSSKPGFLFFQWGARYPPYMDNGQSTVPPDRIHSDVDFAPPACSRART